MQYKALLILSCCLLATGGCNLIYKQNIQQGNAIEQDKLEQLKLGMTMNQVSFLMGTPAISDPFHQDRWDYYYSLKIRRGEPVTRLVTLRFENAILNEMTGVDFDNQDEVVNEETVAADTTPIDETAKQEFAEQDAPIQDQDNSEEEDKTINVEAAVVMDSSFEEPVITPIDTPVSSENELSTDAEVVLEEVAEAIPSVEVPVPAPEQAAQTPEPTAAVWLIQLGVFESRQNAENLVAQAVDAGYQATVSSIGSRFLVRTNGFESKASAQQQLDLINSSLQIDGFLVPPDN